jgi:undecaprenyl diphosphate synthase
MESTVQHTLNVAIIMDGNGRWALRRGLPRTAGHRAGVGAVRRIVEAAPTFGIATLTLFAFSADNWRRPPGEVDALFWLFRSYLRAERRRLVEHGIRLTVIGRRDRLPPRLRGEIERTEGLTRTCERLDLRIAIDYSSREAIARAAARLTGREGCSIERFGELVAQSSATAPKPVAIDLLIRTGGEQRLSDFLLWESAYAELWFTGTMWPDFDAEDLRRAIADFQRRERRFGGLGGSNPRNAPTPVCKEATP